MPTFKTISTSLLLHKASTCFLCNIICFAVLIPIISSLECISLAVSWEPVSDWVSPGHSEGYEGLVMSGKAAGVTCTPQPPLFSSTGTQLSSYPSSLSGESRQHGVRGELIMLAPPSQPIVIFFLYKCFQREPWILISPPLPSSFVLLAYFYARFFSVFHSYSNMCFFKHFQVSYYSSSCKLTQFPAFMMPLYHCIPLLE